MDTPSAPAAPDPAATAAAQSKSNRETAVTQYGLNATNQNTPQGSLSYKQIGQWDDGTPRFEATQSYSPQEQAIYNTGTQTRQNLANIGSNQSAKIGELLNTPFSVDAARDNKIAQIQKGFLDPQWARQQEVLDTQNINKGIRPGSEGWKNAQSDFSTNRQRAYDQSYLDAYKTAESSALTNRNQPINEITALMSGSQVSQPNYSTTPTPGVAPTDYIGAQQQALNQQNLGYQGELSTAQGINSGLFKLGGSALGGWMMSDRRVKDDIKKVGSLDSGLPVYSYRYKGSPMMQLGLMAQDVEQTIPEAVAETDSGYKAVNYSTVAEAHNG